MNKQKIILRKSKKFILSGILNKKNVISDPNYFLSSWAESIGFLNLKKFSGINYSLFRIYKIIFKEYFSIKKDYLILENFIFKNKYDQMVMSYFYPENLKKNGSYDDRYFGVNTDLNKNIIWVLIPTKTEKKKEVKRNIVILDRKSKKFSRNFLFTLFLFIKDFFRHLFFLNIEKIKFTETLFAKSLSEIISNLVISNNISKLILPYEAQPHQHYLINKIKKNQKKINIIGYMHTVIPPLPLDYIKRPGHPDLIYVNGISQKKIFCNKLGWKKREIKNIPSLRYKKNIKDKLNKKILLPYFIEDEEKLLLNFKKLIFLKKRYFFPNLTVKNHPAMTSSKTHLKLITKLSKFLNKNKNFFKNTKYNKNICICLGSTASIAECLERNYKVFHICCSTIFEKMDSFYWTDVKALSLSSHIYEYKLKEKGKIIKFNNSKFKKLNL